MALINEHYLKLQNCYLFSEIAKRINSFKITHPQKKIIHLETGNASQPLVPVISEAMLKAVKDLANKKHIDRHIPEQGYPFLIEAIIKNEYSSRGVYIEPGEVFINEGAKNDMSSIGEILRHDNCIGITDPAHPVYIDSNAMIGRTGIQENGKWSDIVQIPCTEENCFIPELPEREVDILYLCNPNNPTGIVLTKEELKKWVNYAICNNIIIVYDSTCEAYIGDPNIPHSIYEVKGAKKVAIELRSFSKTAGFSGIRCGYTIVPKELKGFTLNGEHISLNKLWYRRQATRLNGAGYIAQKGAEAIYSAEGKKQIKKTIDYYMINARNIKKGLKECGFTVYGGVNAPYLWVKTPNNLSSWKFFDKLLYEVNIAGAPGVGFGPSGEGFLRLTAFGDKNDISEAVTRLKKCI